MAKDVTAVILAGGLGTRLRSAVSDRPKVLADVAGQPFLERIFAQVESFGIAKAVVCTGYMAEHIESLYPTGYKKLAIAYSREHSLLGTGGAVRFALDHVHTSGLLVLNGDSFCDFSFDAFSRFHSDKNSDASLLLTRVEDCTRYGSVVVNPEGRIESFVEKSGAGGPGYINAGVYLLERKLMREVPAGRVLSFEKDIFPSWIGRRFFGYATEAPTFIDIGTPQSFQHAQTLFGSGRVTS